MRARVGGAGRRSSWQAGYVLRGHRLIVGVLHVLYERCRELEELSDKYYKPEMDQMDWRRTDGGRTRGRSFGGWSGARA